MTSLAVALGFSRTTAPQSRVDGRNFKHKDDASRLLPSHDEFLGR
jgi:hypothetical protein